MGILRTLYIWTGASTLILIFAVIMRIVSWRERDPNRMETARWFRRLGRAITKIYPWRIEISGMENVEAGKAYVIVSNHQSFADIPLISCVPIDAKWIGKASLFRIPIAGWMMHASGDIPVERDDTRKAAQAFLKGARTLRNGISVMMFPEGTRSRDGQLLRFNDGPFRLAIREKAPILPLLVEGSGAVLPRNTVVFTSHKRVILRVLPPISVDGLGAPATEELSNRVRGLMQAELDRLRA